MFNRHTDSIAHNHRPPDTRGTQNDCQPSLD